MNAFKKAFNFYVDGFKNLSLWGKQVWIIIIIKLFIMFAVLKLFFFENYLNSKFETEEEKSEYIINKITNSKNE